MYTQLIIIDGALVNYSLNSEINIWSNSVSELGG